MKKIRLSAAPMNSYQFLKWLLPLLWLTVILPPSLALCCPRLGQSQTSLLANFASPKPHELAAQGLALAIEQLGSGTRL